MLNAQRLNRALARPSAELGLLAEFANLRPDLQIHLYSELPSTNETAWQLIGQGRGAGTVVIAARQTAGRGQWGRTWVSPPGGLYMSLVLEPELPLSEGALLTLASAWGIATSLNNLEIPLRIKWPNDLVSHRRKVGGILTESRLTNCAATGDAVQLQQVVVGVGLNWDNPLSPNAISLRELLPEPAKPTFETLEELAAIVLRGILQGVHYWQQQGNAAFVNAYTQKLAHRGKTFKVDGHNARVEGVSLKGDLIVSVGQGDEKFVRTLKSGEISLGYNY